MGYNPNFRGTIGTATKSSQFIALNASGALIARLAPVVINQAGTLNIVDVSDELQSMNITGIAAENIANNVAGTITNGGKIENITTSADCGDVMYVSKTGTLTQYKPNIAEHGFTVGDWVIRVGVIAKNNTNPLQKDLLVNLEIEGQL